jgi:hypothetical protein
VRSLGLVCAVALLAGAAGAQTLTGGTSSGGGSPGGSSGDFQSNNGSGGFAGGNGQIVGTAAQVYTLPTTTATIARTDAGQTFTGANTFSSSMATGGFTVSTSAVGNFLGSGSAVSLVSKKVFIATAPSITGGGTGAAIGVSAGTAAFTYTVGTGPVTTVTFTLPAATDGWRCTASDLTTNTEVIDESGTTTTTAVMTFYLRTTGIATQPTAGDTIVASCTGY